MRFAICNLRFAIVVGIAALVGCDKSDSHGSESQAAPPPVSFEKVRGTAVITGRVKLDGTAPEMKEIANVPCHAGAPKLMEESVVVDSDGGLANVFVFVEGIAAVDGSSLSPAVLDQKNCQYVPHAVGVCVKQPLAIRSSDDAMHNVHYTSQHSRSANFGMTTTGDEKIVRFDSAEFIHVQCDVHPWMNATVGVFANPYFAITDRDGRFEIRDLPAGKYFLVIRHERYGELKKEVEVNDAAPHKVELVFKAP